MKYSRSIFTAIFAIILVIGSAAFTAQAQRRGGTRVIVRPVYVSPYWGYRGFYNPWYYDGFYSDPYYQARRQKYYLQSELNGNRRELREHLEKYNKDGVITAKEQRELDDDYRDVQRSEEKLRDFENGD